MKVGDKVHPMTRSRWERVLAEFEAAAAVEPEQDWRRVHQRVNVEYGMVRLVFVGPDSPEPIARTMRILEVSSGGLTLKGHASLRDGTAVTMHMELEEGMFVIQGRVIHATLTVGGYKVGVAVRFPEEHN